MTINNQRQLGIWLIIALAIIYLQVIIGGTTRLTESGLSITEWNVVTGVVPPLNELGWIEEFKKYQETPEYQEINKGMSLQDFQYIYFWEWLHRIWGRIGFLFLLGLLAVFWALKKLDNKAKKRFAILLLLYIAQGFLGWFMVKSGLVDRPDVSHYRLTAHLLLAIFLFAYVLWWVVDLLVPVEQYLKNASVRRFLWILVGITIVQIIFGGFMSGLRAAPHYPTFPDMNGELIPHNLFVMKPFWINFGEHIPTIQFTHRTLAYLLSILIVTFWYKNKQLKVKNEIFSKGIHILLVILCIQVTLGILVLLNAQGTIPIGLGVAHQAVGLLLLSILLILAFQFRGLGKK